MNDLDLLSFSGTVDEEFLAEVMAERRLRLCFSGAPLFEQIVRAANDVVTDVAVRRHIAPRNNVLRKIETIVFDPQEKVVYVAVKCLFPDPDASTGVDVVVAERTLHPSPTAGEVGIRPAPAGASDGASIREDAWDLMVLIPGLNRVRGEEVRTHGGR